MRPVCKIKVCRPSFFNEEVTVLSYSTKFSYDTYLNTHCMMGLMH